MAGSIKITSSMKVAVVQGAINSFGNFNEQYLKIYNLLMNLDTVRKIRPFNFLKSRSDLSMDAGLFSQWLQTFIEDDPSGAELSNVTCRRVARAVTKMAELYGALLPYAINGEDSFATLFRVFFIPEAAYLSMDEETVASIGNIKALLRLIIWLEMISASSVNGSNASDYLSIMLEYAGASLLKFVSSVNSRSALGVNKVVEG